MNRTSVLNGKSKAVLAAVMAGMLCMLAAWFTGRITHPDLVVRHEAPQNQTAEEAMPGMRMSPEIGKLMEAVGKNPMDGAALYHLAQHLVQENRYDAAENFIARAVAIEPHNPDRLYLLGVVQHNLNKNAEAAATLEQVAALNNDPSVRYSLGILYVYYLNQPDRGYGHLRQALAHEDTPADLKKSIADELAKETSSKQ